MKNLDLAVIGVEEMNEGQMVEVDGGWLKEVIFVLHEAIYQWGFAAGQEDRANNK